MGVLFANALKPYLNGVETLLNQAPGPEPFVHGGCPKFAFFQIIRYYSKV
jgi:hypothetical protein